MKLIVLLSKWLLLLYIHETNHRSFLSPLFVSNGCHLCTSHIRHKWCYMLCISFTDHKCSERQAERGGMVLWDNVEMKVVKFIPSVSMSYTVCAKGSLKYRFGKCTICISPEMQWQGKINISCINITVTEIRKRKQQHNPALIKALRLPCIWG